MSKQQTQSPSEWVEVTSKVFAAKGAKTGWYKIRFVKPDGTEVKLVGKKVKEFYGEEDGGLSF